MYGEYNFDVISTATYYDCGIVEGVCLIGKSKR